MATLAGHYLNNFIFFLQYMGVDSISCIRLKKFLYVGYLEAHDNQICLPYTGLYSGHVDMVIQWLI